MADSEAPGVDRLDEVPEDQDPPAELEFVPVGDGAVGDDEYRFDAFDEHTWHFDPTAPPWYRARSAVIGIVAVTVGVVALIVSVVLLASRPDEDRVPAYEPSTEPAPSSSEAPEPSASTTASTVPRTTSVEPLPAAPPPPESGPLPPEPAEQAPTSAPREDSPSTRKPEFNVTRAPISVAPQQRGAR